MVKAAVYYKGKTILITGATGFIGSSLINALRQVDCTLICCNRNAKSPETGNSAKAHIVNLQMDIRNPSFWDDVLQGVDVIFHFAAQTSARFANEQPIADMDINVTPVVRFVETCQQKGIRPDMIFSGTVTQAGLTRDCPVNESVPDIPMTIYDINKLTAETYLSYYAILCGTSLP